MNSFVDVRTQADPTSSTPPPGPAQRAAAKRTTHHVLLAVLALGTALVIGAVLIAASDQRVLDALPYFLSRPSDALDAIWTSVAEAYGALFTGAIFDPSAVGGQQLQPLWSTISYATPLTLAGLAVAVAFRAHLFNIGVQGQIIFGGVLAAYVGFAWSLPGVLHLPVAVVAAVVAAGIWAGVAGLLKSALGAPEVITTIMLNYVAVYFLDFLLNQAAFRRPGRTDPVSPEVAKSAWVPDLLPGGGVLPLSFVMALVVAGAVWWLVERTPFGFKLRLLGANPSAARVAGVRIPSVQLIIMFVSGGLAGLAAAAQVLGNTHTLTSGVAGNLGWDAITVALLGRNHPLGVVAAALLFGSLRAGGLNMQVTTGTPIDIVLVVQSLIVLFIAAPPLVRALFRLRSAA